MLGRRIAQLHPAQLERLRRFDATQCVDVHSHLLPGLDDGPATLEEALALCHAMVLDGITHAITTPHQLGRYESRNSSIEIRRATERLNQALEEHNLPLQVIAGAEVRLDERMPQMLQADEVLLLPDGGDHLLVELPRGAFIDPFPLIRALYFRGVTVILAHPERQSGMARRMDVVSRWLDEGAAIQINAGSVCGQFGHEAESTAWQWLEAGMVALVASDAHSVERRPPCMTQALQRIEQRLGTAVAKTVCIDNPGRLYGRQQLIPLPRRAATGGAT